MKISRREPLWQFISAIVGIIAICCTIIIYYLQKQYKEISYEIITSSQLISTSKEFEANIKILFDNKPVSNVHLIVFKVINSGNISISAADFERPLTFMFGEAAKVMSADIISVEPNSLKISLNKIDDKISFKPALLNPKDSITIKLLLIDFNGQINPDVRIHGIKDIIKVKRVGYYWFVIGLLGGIVSSFSAILMITLFGIFFKGFKLIIQKP